jgi:hypothetical protein
MSLGKGHQPADLATLFWVRLNKRQKCFMGFLEKPLLAWLSVTLASPNSSHIKRAVFWEVSTISVHEKQLQPEGIEKTIVFIVRLALLTAMWSLPLNWVSTARNKAWLRSRKALAEKPRRAFEKAWALTARKPSGDWFSVPASRSSSRWTLPVMPESIRVSSVGKVSFRFRTKAVGQSRTSASSSGA